MNSEQAINYLKSSGMSDEQIKTVIDAFTCEDCISRQAVLDLTGKSDWFESSNDYNDFVCAVCNLPSVTPTSDAEDKYDMGYICGYTDAMSDIAESGDE